MVLSGIVSWIGSLVTSLFVVLPDRGRQYLEMLAPLHPGGYSPTILGAVIGSMWMFIYNIKQ